jgi:hypothetical protein
MVAQKKNCSSSSKDDHVNREEINYIAIFSVTWTILKDFLLPKTCPTNQFCQILEYIFRSVLRESRSANIYPNVG